MRKALALLLLSAVLPSCAELGIDGGDPAMDAYRSRLHRKVDSIVSLTARRAALEARSGELDDQTLGGRSGSQQMLEDLLLDLERREEGLQNVVAQLEAERAAEKLR